MTESCPLCAAAASDPAPSRGGRLVFKCGACRLAFVERAARLPREECARRYLEHENGPDNAGYCEFLSRAIDAALPFLPKEGKGLDYGCGPGPTLSTLLGRRGFAVADYDPIFRDVPLEGAYDFIFSTECFEHFEEPRIEIAKVAGLLRPGGVLTVMTDVWDDKTDFTTWYYVSDPTHVSFYAEETLAYVARTFGLEPLATDGKRVFVFKKV